MKLIKRVELTQNEKTFIEQLKELSMHLLTATTFDCEGIYCSECPLYREGCTVDRLKTAIDEFIELTEEV